MIGNLVREGAAIPGLATSITLTGPSPGRRTFAAEFANGTTVYYAITDGTNTEIQAGTLSSGPPSTLTRGTPIWTSTSGTVSPSRINFSSTVTVYSPLPAQRAVYTDNFGALLGVTAAAVRTAAGATTTGAALLTAADAAAARTAIGAIDAGSRTFTGAIATSAGDITAQAGSFRSQIAGAPTTGQIVLGNGSARLFWGGAAFDLNGPLTVDGSPVAPRPTASAGVGQWVQINVESNTYTLPGGGSWAYNWQGYSGNLLSGESAGVSAGGTVFSIGPVGSPRFRGFAWRIA